MLYLTHKGKTSYLGSLFDTSPKEIMWNRTVLHMLNHMSFRYIFVIFLQADDRIIPIFHKVGIQKLKERLINDS